MKAATAMVLALCLVACANRAPAGRGEPVNPPRHSESESTDPPLHSADDPTRAAADQSEAESSLQHAQRGLAKIDESSLSSEDRQRLEVARGLVEQAKEALSAGESARAAELARKASVITDDLVGT